MKKEVLECYREAGRVASEALQYGRKIIEPGARVVKVLDKIEEYVRKKDCGLAFPVQTSINEVAAHYCPGEESDRKFKEDGVVKLDVGVHKKGYIADNALTKDLSGEKGELVEASREALNNAVEIIEPGVTLRRIGEEIEEAIRNKGFKPIVNLSGHGLSRYSVHTPPSIPNFDNKKEEKLKEGMVIAVEPFATDGGGSITQKDKTTVFHQKKEGRVRGKFAREVLNIIEERRGLPFTTRWISRKIGAGKTKLALKELVREDILTEHPPLPESSDGLVSQAEHSVILTEEGGEVYTRPE